MHALISGFTLAATLAALTTSVSAQALSDEGTLIRLDPPSRVVTLEDGRMYRAVAGTSFVIDSRSETFDGLRPGARIVVIGGEPVVYRQGRYIALPAVPPTLGLAATPHGEPAVSAPATSPVTVPATALVPTPPRAPLPPAAAWRPAAAVQAAPKIFPILQGAP